VPFEHLAERSQPRTPALGRLAGRSQPLGRLALALDGLSLGLERLAQQPHDAVALGEQLAQPLLEFPLLAIGAARLSLTHLEHLVRTAHAGFALGEPIVDAGQAVFAAGDPRQHVHQGPAGAVALLFQHLEGLPGLA
jgi:hypothetical protein